MNHCAVITPLGRGAHQYCRKSPRFRFTLATRSNYRSWTSDHLTIRWSSTETSAKILFTLLLVARLPTVIFSPHDPSKEAFDLDSTSHVNQHWKKDGGQTFAGSYADHRQDRYDNPVTDGVSGVARVEELPSDTADGFAGGFRGSSGSCGGVASNLDGAGDRDGDEDGCELVEQPGARCAGPLSNRWVQFCQ